MDEVYGIETGKSPPFPLSILKSFTGIIKVEGSIIGKPEEKGTWPLPVNSNDVIFEMIRNEKIDYVGRILNGKLLEIKKIRDEKNKECQTQKEILEFIKKRGKVQKEFKPVTNRNYNSI